MSKLDQYIYEQKVGGAIFCGMFMVVSILIVVYSFGGQNVKFVYFYS